MAKVRSKSEVLQRCFLDSWDLFRLSAANYLSTGEGFEEMHALCNVCIYFSITLRRSQYVIVNKEVLRLLKRNPADFERYVVAKLTAHRSLRELSFEFDM